MTFKEIKDLILRGCTEQDLVHDRIPRGLVHKVKAILIIDSYKPELRIIAKCEAKEETFRKLQRSKLTKLAEQIGECSDYPAMFSKEW